MWTRKRPCKSYHELTSPALVNAIYLITGALSACEILRAAALEISELSPRITMPAQRPSASFEPISPDLDLAALVEETPNFEYVVRISCETIESQGLEAFEKLVLLHVIIGGKPLVIEGFQNRLDSWTFTNQWLQDNLGKKCKLLSWWEEVVERFEN